MTLLLWLGLWIVLSFAVGPLLGAAMRERQPALVRVRPAVDAAPIRQGERSRLSA